MIILRNCFLSLLILIFWSIHVQSQNGLSLESKHNKLNLLIEAYEKGAYGKASQGLEYYLKSHLDGKTQENLEKRSLASYYYVLSSLKSERADCEEIIDNYLYNEKLSGYGNLALCEIAEYYFDKKQYQVSLGFFEEIQYHQVSSDYRSGLKLKHGYSLFELGKYKDAEQLFESLVSEESINSKDAHYYLGMCYYYNGNYEAAISEFKQAEDSEKYNRLIPYYISHIYFAQEDYDKLINYARNSLNNQVENKNGINRLIGKAYYHKKLYDSCSFYLSKYVRVAKNVEPEDLFQLAHSYKSTNQCIKAIPLYRELVSSSGALNQISNYELAECSWIIGDLESARVAFKYAASREELQKLKWEAMFNFGKLSAMSGHHVDAIKALEQIPAYHHKYKSAQIILAEIFSNTTDLDYAITFLEKKDRRAVEWHAAKQKVYLKKGKLDLRNNELISARRYLEYSLNFPSNLELKTEAQYWLGECFYRLGDKAKSEQQFNIVFLNNSSSGSEIKLMAGYNLSFLLFEEENYTRCIGTSKSLLSELKVNSYRYLNSVKASRIKNELYLQLADCYMGVNNWQKAFDAYQDFLDLDNGHKAYALFQQATVKGLLEEYPQKLVLLDLVTDLSPISKWTYLAYLENAKTLMFLNSWEDAMDPLKQLLTINNCPNHVKEEALVLIGLVHFNRGEIQDAERAYLEVINRSTNSALEKQALAGLKELYVREWNQPDRYLKLLENQNHLSVNSATSDSIYFESVKSLYESNKSELFIRQAQDYLSKYNEGIYTHEVEYLLAQYFEMNQIWTEAVQYYGKITQQSSSPYYLSALKKAGLISYLQLKNYKLAFPYLLHYENQLERGSEKLKIQSYLLHSARMLTDTLALDSIARSIITDPISPNNLKSEAHFHLAKHYFSQQEFEKAISYYETAAQLSSSELAAEALFELAYLHYIREDLEASQNVLKYSVKKSAAYPKWLAKQIMLVGQIYLDQLSLYKAKAAFESVIQNYNSDQEIWTQAKLKLGEVNELIEKKSRLTSPDVENNQPENKGQ